ncbi:MAG: hypothetical protein IJD07_03410 [Clostridia bacterium]|nr:hypothetical protein [Clostridia bacterium]
MEEKQINEVTPVEVPVGAPTAPPALNIKNYADLPVRHMWSDTQFDIIRKYIQAYEQTLNPDEELGVCLTQFGQSVMMQVTEITYEKSVTLVFRGLVNGVDSVLIQHISQLNFLLTKLKKQVEEPPKPRRPIGFVMHDPDDDEKEPDQK